MTAITQTDEEVIERVLELDGEATPEPWFSEKVMLDGAEYDAQGKPTKSWGGCTGRIINGPPQTIEQDTLSKRCFSHAPDCDLIAVYRTAALDLLAALKRAQHYMRNCGADMERDYPEIDAAITKAERARSA